LLGAASNPDGGSSTRSKTVDLVMILVSVALLAVLAGMVWAMERL
jgi:hypothetical protein